MLVRGQLVPARLFDIAEFSAQPIAKPSNRRRTADDLEQLDQCAQAVWFRRHDSARIFAGICRGSVLLYLAAMSAPWAGVVRACRSVSTRAIGPSLTQSTSAADTRR